MSDVVHAAEVILEALEANRQTLAEEANELLVVLKGHIDTFNTVLELRAEKLGVDVRIYAVAIVHVHQFDREGGDANGPDTEVRSTP